VKQANIDGPDSMLYFDIFANIKILILKILYKFFTKDTFNTYAVLKIGAVKSATLALRGCKPSWGQEFFLYARNFVF
jgi:hypothetical protein